MWRAMAVSPSSISKIEEQNRNASEVKAASVLNMREAWLGRLKVRQAKNKNGLAEALVIVDYLDRSVI